MQKLSTLEKWLDDLAASSAKKFYSSIRRFADFRGVTGNPLDAIVSLSGMSHRDGNEQARVWGESLIGCGLASGTVCGYISALSSAIRSLRIEGLTNLTIEGVSPKVVRVRDMAGPSRKDLERLILVLELSSYRDGGAKQWRAKRDLAIIRLLHNCGLRRQEALNLRIRDVRYMYAGTPIVVATRKGESASEAIGIGPKAAESMRRWLASRNSTCPNAFVFVQAHDLRQSDTVEAMRGESVRLMLLRRAKEAGVDSIVRPHGLRHTAATHMAHQSNIVSTLAMGMWVSPESVTPYIDRVGVNRADAMGSVDC